MRSTGFCFLYPLVLLASERLHFQIGPLLMEARWLPEVHAQNVSGSAREQKRWSLS